MYNYQSFTVSAVSGVNSHSGVFLPDIHTTPFGISIGAVVNSSCKYTIQHTFDDLYTTSAENCTWFAHDFITATAASVDGNYAFPITGARVEVSGNSDGSVTVTFIQAG